MLEAFQLMADLFCLNPFFIESQAVLDLFPRRDEKGEGLEGSYFCLSDV